jgi:hypothetical protein
MAGQIYKDDFHYTFDQSFCYGACESVYFILSLDWGIRYLWVVSGLMDMVFVNSLWTEVYGICE